MVFQKKKSTCNNNNKAFALIKQINEYRNISDRISIYRMYKGMK